MNVPELDCTSSPAPVHVAEPLEKGKRLVSYLSIPMPLNGVLVSVRMNIADLETLVLNQLALQASEL